MLDNMKYEGAGTKLNNRERNQEITKLKLVLELLRKAPKSRQKKIAYQKVWRENQPYSARNQRRQTRCDNATPGEKSKSKLDALFFLNTSETMYYLDSKVAPGICGEKWPTAVQTAAKTPTKHTYNSPPKKQQLSETGARVKKGLQVKRNCAKHSTHTTNNHTQHNTHTQTPQPHHTHTKA